MFSESDCIWKVSLRWTLQLKTSACGEENKTKEKEAKKLQTWRELWSLVKYLWIRHCKWHHFNQLVISTIVNMKYIVWCNFKFSLDHLYCEECSIHKLFGLLINICNWIAIYTFDVYYFFFLVLLLISYVTFTSCTVYSI